MFVILSKFIFMNLGDALNSSGDYFYFDRVNVHFSRNVAQHGIKVYLNIKVQ